MLGLPFIIAWLFFYSCKCDYFDFYDNTTVTHRGLCFFTILNSVNGKAMQYDFTSIPEKTFPVGSESVVYVSVCQLYNTFDEPFSAPCDHNSILCIGSDFGSKTKYFHKPASVGYETDGTLILTFYEKYYEDDLAKMVIHFKCSTGTTSYTKRYDNESSEYHIELSSPYACPINDLESRIKCILPFSTNYYNLYLHKLRHKKYYAIEDFKGRELYQLNICGIMQNGLCDPEVAVCNVTDRKNPLPLAYVGDFKITSTENGALISFNNKKKPDLPKVHININCLQRLSYAKLHFDSFRDRTLLFSLQSSFVCPPDNYFKCIVPSNENTAYDLTALHNSRPFYSRDDDHSIELDNDQFPFNLCGRDNYIMMNHSWYYSRARFTEKRKKRDRFNQPKYYLNGDIHKSPVTVVKPGHLVLIYDTNASLSNILVNESPCTRSNITFLCSINGTEWFDNDNEKQSCSNQITLHTKHACPIKLTYGKDCMVSDNYPFYSHYNFTQLGEDEQTLQYPEMHFRLRLCQPLVEKCDDDDSAYVCWTRPALVDGSDNLVIGRAPVVLMTKNGEIYFEMFGDRCKFNGPRSKVRIYMRCNYTNTFSPPRLVAPPEMYMSRTSYCIFEFVWYTKLACTQEKKLSCLFQDYDITSLTLKSDNYIIPINSTRSAIALNICHSIVRGSNVMCDTDAASCLINYNAENTLEYSAMNTGNVANMSWNFGMKNWNLKFTHGAYCPSHDGFFETSITFECDPRRGYSNENSKIAFEKLMNCTYFFKWKTPVACPTDYKRYIDEVPIGSDCSIGRSNFIELMNVEFSTKSFSTGNEYNFTVCGSYDFAECAINNGVCVGDKNGKYAGGGKLLNRSRSIIDDRFETITYPAGDVCPQDKSKLRVTKIKMICSFASSEDPFIVDELSNCTTTIAFLHSEACLTHKECTKYSETFNRTFDIREILPVTGNRISTQYGDLILNLCSKNRSCTPRAGCFRDVNNLYNPLILGFQFDGFGLNEISNDGLLKFGEGSVCPNNTLKTLSAELHLSCDLTRTLTKMELIRIDGGCHYVFEWKLKRMCKVRNTITAITMNKQMPENYCLINDSELLRNIDLLKLTNGRKMLINNSYDTYILNLCNHSIKAADCKNGNLCRITHTKHMVKFGYPTETLELPDQNSTVLFYENGDPCGHSLMYAEVWLICSATRNESIVKELIGPSNVHCGKMGALSLNGRYGIIEFHLGPTEFLGNGRIFSVVLYQ